ncbi:MAG: hypothetical protein IH612_07460 [Desulfofustis sp.]|nr:hypothetical protein [Desulfofustis sp.]
MTQSTSATTSPIFQIYNRFGVYGSTENPVSGTASHPQIPAPSFAADNDRVDVSRDAQRLSRSGAGQNRHDTIRPEDPVGRDEPLTTEGSIEQVALRELQSRDREVRAHEQAHLAAAGSYARGGVSFDYQRGPDGRMYAVGGEVGIDLSRAATPEETITKMQTVRRAALAPAEPSAADRQIAAQASIRLAEAQRELQARETQQVDSIQPAADQPDYTAPSGIPAYDGALANSRLRMINAYQAINNLF